ncbi:hypothetical protein I2I05_06260 [Hymenobacter sp. BT683]|uniref:Uncharacterized protein n=1 Tax=Hymenobacter jeongseonensis TaxID=2791027 RepID=A0ABS0IF58_9BACT|nr:hypothetical protein [Hymenobacter jeongseonensis]MBF9236994.1 hypothetical protein [Hymenobacter jeongseonensis]
MFIRATFLSVLFCGVLFTSAAQTASYTKADTARAVRALFDQRRSSARALTAVGGTAMGISAVAAIGGASTDDGLVRAFLFGNAVLLSAVGVPLYLVGRKHHKEVTLAQETAIMAAYEQGQRLPPLVIQRLKRRHFAL